PKTISPVTAEIATCPVAPSPHFARTTATDRFSDRIGPVPSSALNSIFRVAVYEYAATGQAPAAFDPALVQSAFGPRGRRA
ncbi:hypothetical protein BST36_30780, partial [Mycolicibacterium moriokaense]